MRFGRKLALQVTHDDSGAPYLSHKQMKEAINKTVRELRVYQSTLHNFESWRNGFPLPEGDVIASSQDLAEIEKRICSFDSELFIIVDGDLLRIFEHVRNNETQLERSLAELQAMALDWGLIVEEKQIKRLQRTLPASPESPEALCQQLIGLHLRSNPVGMAERLVDISIKFNAFVEQVDEHTQYLEINVAGFRKLLKRHEKQIPQKFHAVPTPYLGFHKLVTRTSRQLTDLVRIFGAVVGDARERLLALTQNSGRGSGHISAELVKQINVICCQLPELLELRGLGPESEMVLEIQKQLKEPAGVHLLQAANPRGVAPAGYLYPKPGGGPILDTKKHGAPPFEQFNGHLVKSPMDPHGRMDAVVLL